MTYADAEGKNHPVFMGSYGIGISRVMGTIVEVCNDKNGMIWPEEVAPFAVHLVSLCVEDSDVAKVDALYQKLVDAGVSVLYDDRDLRPGQKFAESDIIGIPHRVIMSKKTMQDNSVEYIDRKAGNTEFLTADDVVRLTASWQSS